MQTIDDLIAQARSYNPKSNAEMIAQAYAYADEMHGTQTRHSGEPYITHPLAVAIILADQKLDDATIITALLHDVIEDTKATYSDVEERFGTDVADLVNGVTKLTNLPLSNKDQKQASNFRKLFMAMSKDLRVILVKLADRVHNMRTISAMRPEKQVLKAQETMEIYAPLAGRMGMQSMREELEDLCFEVLNPDGRRSIMRRFVTLRTAAGDVIERIQEDMDTVLAEAEVKAEVLGRAKRPFSIWRKMREKEQTFSRLSDIYGFRVITQSEDCCYRALGAIHRRWSAVPGRFKDYISQPKTNGYRSIHTTVLGRDAKRIEVQIRTVEMNEVAEAGVAAHWSYRDGERVENRFAVDPVRWVSSLSDSFDHDDDHSDFLEAVKLEMFPDKVFCFTPKGEVIKLPRGATPLDFAYAIHSRLGNACVGSKVDGIRAPLWHRIKNGQSIEILTAEGNVHSLVMLDVVKTGKARAEIRKANRGVDQQRHAKLGRELLRSTFDHAGRKLTDKILDAAASQFRLKDSVDLLARVGRAEMKGQEVLQAVYPEITYDDADPAKIRRPVVGLGPDQSFSRAACCHPLPGERIVGIATDSAGVEVHAIDCDTLARYDDEPERWIDLHWEEGTHPAIYDSALELTIGNDMGVLGRICTMIGEQQANISDLVFVDRKPDFFRLYVQMELRDVEQLHNLILMLNAESDVAEVRRVRRVGKDVRSARAGR